MVNTITDQIKKLDDAKIIFLDIESDEYADYMWTQRTVLTPNEAKIMYDHGMYDTLEIIEIYGKKWIEYFITQEALDRIITISRRTMPLSPLYQAWKTSNHNTEKIPVKLYSFKSIMKDLSAA